MNDLALRRDALGGCAALIAFATAFFLLQLIPIPLFWYHPLEHAFRLETRPAGLAMDFYGRTLWAMLAAIAAFPVGYWLAGRLVFTKGRVWLWVGYGLAMTVLAVSLIGYQIWPRPANPIPIPSWYSP